MRNTFQFLIILFFSAFLIIAQEKEEKQQIKNSVNGAEASQAVEGDVIFSDGTNQLLRITDEGNFGVIQFPVGVPSSTTNKLYNNGGALYFNGASLSSGGSSLDSINNLADARFDGSSLFLGVDAGLNDDGLNSNTGVGRNSLFSNTSGGLNTGLGFSALNQNTAGLGNVAVGYKAAFANTTGGYITAVGHSALTSNTTGIYNTSLGVYSLSYNTTGHSNIGIGYHANFFNQTGSRNTVIGHRAGGGYNNSRSGNVFIGYQSGFYEADSNKLYIENSNSTSPLIWGDFAEDSLRLNANLHVKGNLTIDGYTYNSTSLNELTDAIYDGESLFIGEGAGTNDDSGLSDGSKNFNLGIGKNTLSTNLSGNRNAAIGNESQYLNESGSRNTTLGTASQYNNFSGNANVALGFQSNYFNETGENNTLIGTRAGYGSTGISFSGNVFIGYQAGYNEITSDKLYIENTDSDTPLIWGDFLMDQVRVNGSFEATTKIVTPKIKLRTGASEGHVLTSDADGNATWQSPENIGFSGYLEFDMQEDYYSDRGDNLFNYFIEEYDLGNVFDPTTGEFTAPLDGFYNFVLNVTWREKGADFIARVKIKKNGQVFPGSSYQTNVNTIHSAYTTVSFSLNIYLQENDVITAWFDAYNPILPGGGGVIPGNVYTVVGGNGEYTSTFSGFKVH